MNLDCDDKSPGRPIAPIPLLYKLRSNSLLNLFSGELGDEYILLFKANTCLTKDGLLVLLSPYTWLEDYTPKENWLGGYIKDNKEVYTLDTLKEHLKDFELLETIDVPFVIKETSRKYQHTISEMTIWKKKA